MPSTFFSIGMIYPVGYLTLVFVSFVPWVNGVAVEGPSFFDPCQRLARQTFNEQSNCDAETMLCSSLYWESAEKGRMIYRSIGEGMVGELTQVTCGESAVFFSPESQRRKRKLAVRGRKPVWFKRDNTPLENIQAGIDSVLNILSSELTPFLRRWPLGSIGTKEELAMSTISRFVKVLRGIDAGEAENEVEAMKASYRDEDSRWLEWVLFMQENDRIGASARFDREDILVNFYPFAHLHVFIIESLFGVENYLDIDDDGIELTVLPELLKNVRPNTDDRMDAGEIEDYFKAFIPRLNVIWSQLQTSDAVPIVEHLTTDFDMFKRLEAMVLRISSLNDDTAALMHLRTYACPNLLKLETFIAHITPNQARRGTRLILSLTEICKDVTSLTERHRLIGLLPEVIAAETLFVKRNLLLPWDKEAQFEYSLRFLANENLKLNYNLIIRFAGSPANGIDGPRNQWLSVMFEKIFDPNGRFFKYSDETTKQFLIPNGSMDPDLFLVVGRVIGLGIRYGLTIGARLTPCSLALLRAPLVTFDVERCVAREDAEFVANLKKLQLAIESQDSTAISLTDENLTLETFPEYMKNVLYEKGIGRIRTSMTLIKRGIRTILPLTALELFTEQEFEEMINGNTSLSPDTLWAGIRFLNKRDELEYYSTWLKEILSEQSEAFRFAFNRFITALPQPPVGKNEPWIWISIDEKPARSKNLPSAQTCSKSLILPLYQDKATLLEKLTTALFEGGTDSLQLC